MDIKGKPEAPKKPVREASPEALLKDLDIQWRDHHHMRDQTWRTLASTVTAFAGAIALKSQDVGPIALCAAYALATAAALIGYAVTTHHRHRQQQKFHMIREIEERLGLLDVKRKIIDSDPPKVGFAGRVFTGNYIGWLQLGVGLIAMILVVESLALRAQGASAKKDCCDHRCCQATDP